MGILLFNEDGNRRILRGKLLKVLKWVHCNGLDERICHLNGLVKAQTLGFYDYICIYMCVYIVFVFTVFLIFMYKNSLFVFGTLKVFEV